MSAAFDTSAARSSLSTLAGALTNAAHQALRDAVKVASDSAKGTALFKDRSTGTRVSIASDVFGDSGFVKAGGAAHFLEYGTPPHTITAVNGRFLCFQMNGKTVFRRSVHHPGTAERPFMREARDLGEQALEHGVDFYFDYAIARAR